MSPFFFFRLFTSSDLFIHSFLRFLYDYVIRSFIDEGFPRVDRIKYEFNCNRATNIAVGMFKNTPAACFQSLAIFRRPKRAYDDTDEETGGGFYSLKIFCIQSEPTLNSVICDSREFAKINRRCGLLYFLELNFGIRERNGARCVKFCTSQVLTLEFLSSRGRSTAPMQILNVSRPR